MPACDAFGVQKFRGSETSNAPVRARRIDFETRKT